MYLWENNNMRKIAAALSVIILFSALIPHIYAYETDEFIYGDCNGNNEVNAFDCIRLKREIISGNLINDKSKISADCNNDLKITWNDFNVVSQYILEDSPLPFWEMKGWCSKEDGKCFYNNNEVLTGEQFIFGNRYYFNSEGILKTDWNNLRHIVDTSSSLYTYVNMTNQVYSLADQYPALVSVSVMRQTDDQRSIYDIRFGNPDASHNVVIQASCHAREYMTSMLVMNQLEYYLQNYYTGSYNSHSYEELFSDVCFHIVPMLNPDGVSISQYGGDAMNNPDMRAAVYEIYQYERSNGITTLNMADYFKKWKANGHGVDLNRNFNSYWTSDRPVKHPSSSGYPGACAASEIETQTLQNLIQSLSGLDMVLSYHSSGSYIYWAYGQRDNFRNECKDMADRISSATGYYLLNNDDYDSGCSNWVSSLGIKAETIEIGIGDSPLVYSEYQSIWDRNKNVWAVIADRIR